MSEKLSDILSMVNEIREGDMYDVYVDKAYHFFMDTVGDSCDGKVLEIGYALSDIYDHINIQKSEKIVLQILEHGLDFIADPSEKLQKRIGCIYTLAIIAGKRCDIERLKEVGKEFDLVLDDLDRSKSSLPYAKVDLLYGLYYSNHGAWYNNMANVSEVDRELYLDKSIKDHYNALKHRKKYLDRLEESDKEYNKALEYYTQSKSNIAGIYYLKGNYKKAIEIHEQVDIVWNKLGKISKLIRTKNNIIGCYRKLMQSNEEVDLAEYE